MGQHSSPKGPAAGLLSFRCLRMLLKEEGMLHSGKHGPVITFRKVSWMWFISLNFYILKCMPSHQQTFIIQTWILGWWYNDREGCNIMPVFPVSFASAPCPSTPPPADFVTLIFSPLPLPPTPSPRWPISWCAVPSHFHEKGSGQWKG